MGIDYIPGDGAGEWRQDPISQAPIALGAHWADVKPFVHRLGQPVPHRRRSRP